MKSQYVMSSIILQQLVLEGIKILSYFLRLKSVGLFAIFPYNSIDKKELVMIAKTNK